MLSPLPAFRTSFVLTVVALCVGCQRASTPLPKPTQTVQRLQCNYIVGIDSARPVAVFSIRNDTQVTKVLSRTRKSCACFRAELSDPVISPGSAASLSLYMNETGLRHISRKTIECDLEFTDGSHSSCTAECIAYPVIAWNDDALNVGTIPIDATVAHNIPVVVYTRVSTAPTVHVRAETIECEPEYPVVPFALSTDSDGVYAHSGSIKCDITPTNDRKSGGTALVLRIDGDKCEYTESLALSWNTQSEYSFQPRMLVLRGVKDAPDTVASVIVDRDRGTDPITIDRIDHSHSDILRVEALTRVDHDSLTLKMTVKSPLSCAEPLYGDVLLYIAGSPRPLFVWFVVVP